jgi:hypothetical protein
MPVPLELNKTVPMKGFITQAKFLRSHSASELEQRLGYGTGRLANGWWLLFLEQMPQPNDYEFMAYSHMSGGVPQGHLNPPGGRTTEQSLQSKGFDMTVLKQKTIRDTFTLTGPDRLAKVIPVLGGDAYPQGKGIPQWKLLRDLTFRAVAEIAPNQTYTGNYT